MEEAYYEILRVIEEVTGINVRTILSSNKEENVDARHMLVYVMHKYGFTDNKISELTKLTRPCVCMIRNNFKYRLRRYFVKLYYDRVMKAIFKGKELVKNLSLN